MQILDTRKAFGEEKKKKKKKTDRFASGTSNIVLSQSLFQRMKSLVECGIMLSRDLCH